MPALLQGFYWIWGVIAVYYCLAKCDLKVFLVRPKAIVPLLITTALFVRLVPAVLLPVGAAYDIESFERVAQALLGGRGVYSSPIVQGRHPYFPLQMYLIGAAMRIAQATGWPFVFVVKWSPIIADGALTALIFSAYANSTDMKSGLRLAFSYALNPVSILISAYHGQFDAVPAFLLALSWYLWYFGKRSGERIGWSALALGGAVLDKTWPLIFLPILLLRLKSWSERLRYGLFCAGVLLAGTMLYLLLFPGDMNPLLKRALTHAGVPGWWGMSAIFNITQAWIGWGEGVLSWMAIYGRWLVLICVGATYWFTRARSAIQALVTAILALYASTTGFGLQWGLWIIPFALLSGDDLWVRRYVAAMLLHLVPSYFGYHLDQSLTHLIGFHWMALIMQASSIPAWAMILFWLCRLLSPHRDRINHSPSHCR